MLITTLSQALSRRQNRVVFKSIAGMMLLTMTACGSDGGVATGASVQDRGRSASPVPGTDDDGNNPVIDTVMLPFVP